MQLSPDTLLSIIVAVAGGVAALGVRAYFIVSHLEAKRERGDNEIRSRMESVENGVAAKMDDLSTQLHSRVNNVRNEYVQKHQYEADRLRTDRKFEQVESAMCAGFNRVNDRLDKILTAVSKNQGNGNS